MVLNRKIADINIIPASNLKFYQRMMEINGCTGRRWNLSGVSTHHGNVIGIPTSGIRLPNASEPTTHQKIHRIIDEHEWKQKSNDRKLFTSKNCLSLNHNIGLTQRQLSRGDGESSYGFRENSIENQLSGLSLQQHNKSSGYNCQLVNGRGDETTHNGRDKKSLLSNGNWERQREVQRSNSRSKNVAISTSSIASNNLKEGLGFNPSGRVPIDGILKKSSLIHDKYNESKLRKCKLPISRHAHGIVTNLKKSPSCQTLNINLNRNSSVDVSSVKKSVSFSLDTSFAERKTPVNKKVAAVHEAKVYRKGVLRDVFDVVVPKKKSTELSLSTNKELIMSQSLLKAARDGDDVVFTNIAAKIRRSSHGHYVDVNATDSSGRSAISYITGNGADDMLEIALSLTGVNPNLPDNEGNTPLHFAAQAGQAESLNILLQRCTSIELDARNILGFTPLMKAAIQGRTKCAKILLFAGANPTLRDYGRGLRAEQWAKYCGRHVCADIIERFSRHRLMEKTSCRWGSEPELATKVLQGKVIPMPSAQAPMQSSGFKSKIKRVFKSSSSDRSFSLVSQLTNAALCASTPALPKPGDIVPVRSLIRPLVVPQLRVTLITPADLIEKNEATYIENNDGVTVKPSRAKKKNK